MQYVTKETLDLVIEDYPEIVDAIEKDLGR